MKGGARVRSGPAPDPQALRRDTDPTPWTYLPAEGRTGEAPAFPLIDPTDEELRLWRREWTRPQATVWEINGQDLEVALYVRSLVAAARPDARVSTRVLVRQQQDALGLSLSGMARYRWRLGTDAEVIPHRTGRPAHGRFKETA